MRNKKTENLLKEMRRKIKNLQRQNRRLKKQSNIEDKEYLVEFTYSYGLITFYVEAGAPKLRFAQKHIY